MFHPLTTGRASYYCVGPNANLTVLADLMMAVLDFDVAGVFDDGVWEMTGQTRHEAKPFLKVSWMHVLPVVPPPLC